VVRIFYKSGKSSSQALKPLFFAGFSKILRLERRFGVHCAGGMARSGWNRYTVAPFFYDPVPGLQTGCLAAGRTLRNTNGQRACVAIIAVI
jgi:hypothetical protein